MVKNQATIYPPNTPLRWPAPFFLVEWIVFLADLACRLYQLWQRSRHEGMYEILEYDSVLELCDPKGKTAVFKRHQRVKFLQDDVIAFQDHAWGDGEIFADYQVSPGVEVDRYQDGDRWNVLISLRETKSSGDVEDFYIQRTIKGGFTKTEEWRQTDIRYQTRHLRLAIIFPRKRRCQRAVLIERNRNRTTELEQRQFSELPDGRQMLTWETKHPKRFEIYTIRWKW